MRHRRGKESRREKARPIVVTQEDLDRINDPGRRAAEWHRENEVARRGGQGPRPKPTKAERLDEMLKALPDPPRRRRHR